MPCGFGWAGEARSEHEPLVLEPVGKPNSDVERFEPLWVSFYGGRVDYSPDERRIAVSGISVVYILSAQSYQTEKQLFGHTAGVLSVRWSPDGRYLASGANDPDRTVKIWEAESGRLVRTLQAHTGGVGSVAWSPDGKRLASAGYYGGVELIIWEASTGEVLRTLPGGKVAAWSPDGRYMASAYGYRVNLYEVETGTLVRTFEGHNQVVETVAWSPDGQYLASGAGAPFDGTVKVWEVKTGRLIRTLIHGGPVSVAWSPDGNYLAAAGGYIKIWESDTGRLIRTLGEDIRPTLAITSIAWTPDSQYLLSGGGGVINLWDVKIGQPIVQRQEHRTAISAVAWSSDGHYVASVGSDWYDPGIKIWDSATGHLEKIIGGAIFRADLLEWSPDGRYL
ncbi:MAG: WD40 repeat domain-containing protein, partial [Acidobacteria bacterium]|nr:WD40 repeat domain-containing protein [Acidobacteriota bacterium]